LEFVRLALPLLRIGWGRFFDRNIWPDFRVFRIQQQPFLKPRLGVRLDRIDWTFRHAHSAIDAFVRVDDEHVLALVETVHWAHFTAVHGFAAYAALVDDVGQLNVLSAGRSGELTCGVFAVQAAQAELQKQHLKRKRFPEDLLQASVQGAALALATPAFDAQYVELAFDVTEYEIASDHSAALGSALVSLSQLYQRFRLSSCPFFLFGLASSLNKFLRRYSQHILDMRVPRLGCNFLAL